MVNDIKEKNRSDGVIKWKASHSKIEIIDKVREAKSKKELNLEIKRLGLINEIDKSTIGETLKLPKELQNWQQLILIIGNLNLKTSTEVLLACKKLGYSGILKNNIIKDTLSYIKKEFFKFDKETGWQLTNLGEKEFLRLKNFC
jgi:hypothetical protein